LRPVGEEYFPLFNSLEGLNFDHMRRKRAFKLGDIPILKEEFEASNPEKLRGFKDLLDISPV